MSHRKFPRRTFLKGLGATIAIPYLPSVMSLAKAASGPNVRFCAMTFPNGIHNELQWQNRGERHEPSHYWTPPEYFNGHSPSLTSFTMPTLMQAVNGVGGLDALKNDITIVGGLQNAAYEGDPKNLGGHPPTTGTWLTNKIIQRGPNQPYSISMDQYIANALGDQKSIQVSNESWDYGENYNSDAYCGHCSYLSDTDVKPKMVHPGQVFLQLFGDVPGGKSIGNGMVPSNPAVNYSMMRKKSILDAVLSQAGDLLKFASTDDKAKMDQYFTAVRTLESRLQNSPQPLPPALGCTVPSRTAKGMGDYPKDYKDSPGIRRPFSYGDNCDLMMDLIVLAFQCNITRVATYLFGTDATGGDLQGLVPGFNANHHLDYAHPGNMEMMNACNRWILTQYGRFLSKLKAVPDGNGTLLDNSIVYFGAGYADGGMHSSPNLPAIVGGRGGGALTPGKYLNASNYRAGNGYDLADVAQLNLALIQKMGVAASGWGEDNNKQAWTKPITGL